MKLLVALAAICAVIALATAAPSPNPQLYIPSIPFPTSLTYGGGGGSEAASMVAGDPLQVAVAPTIGMAVAGIPSGYPVIIQ